MELPLTPPISAEEQPMKKRRTDPGEEQEGGQRISELRETYPRTSSLQTPPLSENTSPRLSETHARAVQPSRKFTEPARYLATLVRIREKGVAAIRPEVIERILWRSGLNAEVIAFGACILYRVSWRFVREWKQEMLAQGQTAGLAAPEVIVLAALRMASSWLEDETRSTRFWNEDVGREFSREAFLASQLCILRDPASRLLEIDAQELSEMREDMEFVEDPKQM